ncbi:MAG: DUF5339 domain-containing protein [Pasteurella oralis]|uniref:DUF5339 domain-containing protein n=1 Tax=Pasteurella oralis TaxID=1071947 RepID=UPI0026FB8970|nr:DUF5339 domain-containing protein [Pasteurella oralis]
MKNFFSFVLASPLLCLAFYANAQPQATASSSKIVLSEECQKLFQEGEKLINDATKQPGTHLQVKQLKERLHTTKQKTAQLDSTMQQKSCEKGLRELDKLKQQY